MGNNLHPDGLMYHRQSCKFNVAVESTWFTWHYTPRRDQLPQLITEERHFLFIPSPRPAALAWGGGRVFGNR
ncbi:hypothetical protein J6590_053187 [Homalodisca vitripennis]|nr:hypothetical protein J6590_053187 [Homalodisca vitripennis]